MAQEKYELPEICYDEPLPGHQPNPFPFIVVKKDQKHPPVLFIEIRKETGETEPGDNGRPVEIVDSLMHKYVDMETLKEKLPPHMNDIIRTALGMQPLKEAQARGQKILDKATRSVEKIVESKGKKKKN